MINIIDGLVIVYIIAQTKPQRVATFWGFLFIRENHS